MNNTVAVTAIVVSGAVGLAGLIVPFIQRAGDRKHERATGIRHRRADAYEGVLRLMGQASDMQLEGAKEQAAESAIFIWLWGSQGGPRPVPEVGRTVAVAGRA